MYKSCVNRDHVEGDPRDHHPGDCPWHPRWQEGCASFKWCSWHHTLTCLAWFPQRWLCWRYSQMPPSSRKKHALSVSEPHTDGALGITKGRVGWMNTSTWSIFWRGAQKTESKSGSPRGEASCFHYLHQAFLPSTAVPYLCNAQRHCSRSAQSHGLCLILFSFFCFFFCLSLRRQATLIYNLCGSASSETILFCVIPLLETYLCV